MTTKHPPLYYLPLWEAADAEEIGLHITCANDTDQRSLVVSLYECRKQAGRFQDMIILQPNPIGTIYIAHKTVELPE